MICSDLVGNKLFIQRTPYQTLGQGLKVVEEASVFQIVRLFQIARMEAEDEGFVEVIKNKQRAN